ncbi:MAG: hypothetical protein ACYC28_09145 [Longimicrobiales bacterium]
MPEERGRHGISDHEHADRRHNAETAGPAPAITGDEGVQKDGETDQDRVARAAGAVGPDTVTDPLELMSMDDRFERGEEHQRRSSARSR